MRRISHGRPTRVVREEEEMEDGESHLRTSAGVGRMVCVCVRMALMKWVRSLVVEYKPPPLC